MEINFYKMKEIFGTEIFEIIKDNIDNVEQNIKYMIYLNFDDIEGLFERCPYSFIDIPKQFKIKIDKLIREIGKDYIRIIQNNVELLENL